MDLPIIVEADHITEPDYKPQPYPMNVSYQKQSFWDTRNVAHLYKQSSGGYDFLDRVEKELFVGRYNMERCSAITSDAAERSEYLIGINDLSISTLDEVPHVLYFRHKVYKRDSWATSKTPVFSPVAHLKYKEHAYIVSITPEGAECRCQYCGDTFHHGPHTKREYSKVWDEPFDEPRRATDKELKILLKKEFNTLSDRPPIGRLLYIDDCHSVYTGRISIGECPKGGPHEVICCWLPGSVDTDIWQSYCLFCGEVWDGPPPGFYDLTEPYKTIDKTLKEHEDDVRAGKY